VVAKNFQEAGTRVHAYIMYGFPTQTAQETIDALDVVRQLFKHGLITSASWAKFGVTPHSPIGRNPEEYGIELLPTPKGAFIEQIIAHRDPANDHDRFTDGLNNAVRYFSLGYHHDTPVEGWFDFEVPKVSIDRELIKGVLEERAAALAAGNRRPPVLLRTIQGDSPSPLRAAEAKLQQASVLPVLPQALTPAANKIA